MKNYVNKIRNEVKIVYTVLNSKILKLKELKNNLLIYKLFLKPNI